MQIEIEHTEIENIEKNDVRYINFAKEMFYQNKLEEREFPIFYS